MSAPSSPRSSGCSDILTKFSPTAGLGFGWQYVQNREPPAPLQKDNQMAYVSLGARGFITRRFMCRADWRKFRAPEDAISERGGLPLQASDSNAVNFIIFTMESLNGNRWLNRGGSLIRNPSNIFRFFDVGAGVPSSIDPPEDFLDTQQAA